MTQRRLRLGDILDDYCPRERRVTNHAIVAIVGDEVKHTRCTTCDADHEYKQAKVPAARRKKLEPSAPGDAAEGLLRPRPVEQDQEQEPLDVEVAAEAEPMAEPVEVAEVELPPPADEEAPMAAGESDDDGPVHRRLIRATLPRPEGQSPERKEPDFTIRQPGGRGRDFDGNRNGQRPGRRQRRGPGGGGGQQPPRFGQGPRHGNGQNGPRHGSGPGRPQGQHGPRNQGNRPGGGGPAGGNQRGGGRPPGQGQGRGRKRGR